MKRALKTDDYVRTADKSMGRIRYIWKQEAEVAIDDDTDNTVTLPLSELRRIPNPWNKLPPIEGIPDERPHCDYCKRELRPRTDREYDRSSSHWRVTRRTFSGWSCYGIPESGQFCTKACAIRFAWAAYRAGYRITKRGK